eukprot:8271179-Pyramimonas_sp.AAC.1
MPRIGAGPPLAGVGRRGRAAGARGEGGPAPIREVRTEHWKCGGEQVHYRVNGEGVGRIKGMSSSIRMQ